MSDSTTKYRQWDLGQRHLAAGRYVPARQALQSAEALAWRTGDARSLARIHLPLLESSRLIRQAAVEGPILITQSCVARLPRLILEAETATVLTPSRTISHSIQLISRRTGRSLESLMILPRPDRLHLVSPADPAFAAGLSVTITSDPHATIADSTAPELSVPLPPTGLYPPASPLHPVAQESLLVAWEALALCWQRRHPLKATKNPWRELAWLRQALTVDPACEPIAMRLIALAEVIERVPKEAGNCDRQPVLGKLLTHNESQGD